MATKSRRKLDIGAVVEVPTSRGFGYLQYTHWNELMGALVRVLPGLHASRPTDIDALARQTEVYVTFVPVLEAINAGLFEFVGPAEVPGHARRFPLFRAAGPREPRTGEPYSWWLWDGKNESKLSTLSKEQQELPIREAVMPPVLVARIEAGWKPGDREPNISPPPEDQLPGGGHQLRHYLYFRDEVTARRAAAVLSDEGMPSEVKLSARGVDWLVHAHGGDAEAIEDVRAKLEKLASKLDGEYDGWEAGC